jgi:hypothetical protein
MSEQSPNGVNGLSTLLVGERAGDAVIEQTMCVRDPARHVLLVLAPHQKKVGRRQHRHGDPSVGQAAAISARRERLIAESLVTVADRDPAAPAGARRSAADLVEMHPGRGSSSKSR